MLAVSPLSPLAIFVITHIIVTFRVVVVVVVVVGVVVIVVVIVVLIWTPLSVKDTDGQLIGLWHPVTNFASVRLVECPHTRGQFSSCVPVTFCGTLLPRSSRHYCRWDGTEPYVCCPQQPTSQPLIHKSKVSIQCLLSSTFNCVTPWSRVTKSYTTSHYSQVVNYHRVLPKTILIQLMLFLYPVFFKIHFNIILLCTCRSSKSVLRFSSSSICAAWCAHYTSFNLMKNTC